MGQIAPNSPSCPGGKGEGGDVMDDARADTALQTGADGSEVKGGNPETPGLTVPGPIRRWLKQWSERRILKAAKIRLALTAPHLLEDIGLEDPLNEPLRRRQHMAPLDETQVAAGSQDTLAMAAE